MYQNSKEIREMKKMSNVEVSGDIFEFNVQIIRVSGNVVLVTLFIFFRNTCK